MLLTVALAFVAVVMRLLSLEFRVSTLEAFVRRMITTQRDPPATEVQKPGSVHFQTAAAPPNAHSKGATVACDDKDDEPCPDDEADDDSTQAEPDAPAESSDAAIASHFDDDQDLSELSEEEEEEESPPLITARPATRRTQRSSA